MNICCKTLQSGVAEKNYNASEWDHFRGLIFLGFLRAQLGPHATIYIKCSTKLIVEG